MEANERWQKFASLFANMVFGSWYFLIGGLLATHLPLRDVVLALLLGNILVSILFYAIGVLGFLERKPTYEIAKPAFGEYGSRFLISLLLVFARIGWVAVRAQLGGFALSMLLGIPAAAGIVLFTAALILATIGSFTKLSLYGLLALAGTVLLSFVGLQAVFQHWNMNIILSYRPSDPFSLSQAINLILISKISFGAIVPDFFQKAKTKRDVFWGSVMGFLPSGLIAGTIGAMLTIVTGSYDLVEILRQLSLPGLAFLFLAVSSFAPATLFPTGVGIASILNKPTESVKRIGVVVAGIMGAAIAFFGIVQRLSGFLNFLGTAFAPIFGVLFVEYYLKASSGRTKKVRAAGVISWAIGAVVVYVTTQVFPVGVASVNGMAVSALLYYLTR